MNLDLFNKNSCYNSDNLDDLSTDISFDKQLPPLKKINQDRAKILHSFGDNCIEDLIDNDNEGDFLQYFANKISIKKDDILTQILTATVYKIKGNDVIIDMNLKNYGKLNKEELKIGFNNLDIKIGDKLPVLAESIDAKFGPYIKTSWEKAKRIELWDKFEELKNNKTIVYGAIQSETRGGYIANIMGVKVFVPGSHVDFRPPEKEALELIKSQEQPFIVLSMERDDKKNNIVVSRREVLNLERMKIKDSAIEKIKIGDVLTGIVKNIAPYGCFINLQIPGMENIPVDGLLHINDISWSKIAHPSELLALGAEIKVMVINLLPEEKKISLGTKQLTDSPWKGLSQRLVSGTKVKGVVKNITDYGYFVDIDNGVEGLVHISEVSWSKKGMSLSIGQEVEVMILLVDEEKSRISLSIKQCFENPWKKFAEKNKVNDVISAKIKKIVDFGVFIDLGSDIEGLIHISDLSWEQESCQKILAKLQTDSMMDMKILSIDVDKGRVALGIKQFEKDYFYDFLENAKINDIVKCVILNHWNEKMEIMIVDAKTTTVLEGDSLPIDFIAEKQTKYLKDTQIDCKIIDINLELRKVILTTRI